MLGCSAWIVFANALQASSTWQPHTLNVVLPPEVLFWRSRFFYRIKLVLMILLLAFLLFCTRISTFLRSTICFSILCYLKYLLQSIYYYSIYILTSHFNLWIACIVLYGPRAANAVDSTKIQANNTYYYDDCNIEATKGMIVWCSVIVCSLLNSLFQLCILILLRHDIFFLMILSSPLLV